MDNYYQAFKEKEAEQQIQKMLTSKKYTTDEIAWITGTSTDFVEDVKTRTFAEKMLKVFDKLGSWLTFLFFLLITIISFFVILASVVFKN